MQSGDQYQIFMSSGTLRISSLESIESDLVTFTCMLYHGSDNRTFTILIIGELTYILILKCVYLVYYLIREGS